MSSPSSTIPLSEKIGYALGDVATNFFFQSMILYQGRFYTDTVGLSANTVGFMFLVLRLADAFFDPIIGALSDRTNTRWGKFRPWVLWTALPFGLTFWLVYVSPNFGPQGKLIYAYVTYVLVMAMYSANNTPYSALMGVMTPNVSDRANIARYRFVAALIGQLLIQAIGQPLVRKLGQGDDAKGWAITMAIFGSVIVISNIFVFLTTKERVHSDPGQKPSLSEDLKNVFGCKPWIIMFVLTLVYFTMLVVRGSSLNYFYQYFVDPSPMRAFLGKFGLATPSAGEPTGFAVVLDWFGLLVKSDFSNAAAVGFSFFSVLGSIVQIIGIPFSKPLADRFGKKPVFIVGLSVVALATAGMFLIQPTNLDGIFWLSVLWAAGWGPTVPLLWLMIADVADFSEWKTSRRATGFMYAGILFGLKAGLGLGGAVGNWILGLYGYAANATQSEHALLGIRLGASIFPALMIVFCIGCVAVYPISKDLNLQIQNELEERRKKFATA
jgi:GPH family glycoside/pentoside/hexuronide:cation symporter